MKKIILLSIVCALMGCDAFLPVPPLMDMTYIAYSDYYNGAGVALKFDITNNGDKTIEHIRPKFGMTWKYGAGSSICEPDFFATIAPGETVYSQWIEVAYGSVFYQAHAIYSAMVWFDDGTMITVDYP
jgi:hypothetical protein